MRRTEPAEVLYWVVNDADVYRFERIASYLPNKTPNDIQKRLRDLEVRTTIGLCQLLAFCSFDSPLGFFRRNIDQIFAEA